MAGNFLTDMVNSLLLATNSIISSIVSFIPTLLAAVVVFVIGLLLANWARSLVIKLTNLLGLSEFLANRGLKQFLENADIRGRVESVLGEMVRYLIILIFAVAGLNLLGLTTVTAVLNGLLSYLPHIFSATIIFIAGVILAGFLEKVIKGSLAGFDLKLSRLMAKLVSYLVVVFAILASVSELGIATNLIDAIFIGFIGMLALAFGLALGLGSKDLVKSLLEDWYKSIRKELK